jgi:hypothetical protein
MGHRSKLLDSSRAWVLRRRINPERPGAGRLRGRSVLWVLADVHPCRVLFFVVEYKI